ncbi:hypothetical protein BJ165DRAFT_233218 [Panaeolus papilionaceus]|nr:hypothetical protein BJ165DRAFT_233218 [Panaeolus papilionaceus]
MLQTQTSLGAAHQASVAAALSRWDILNDRMLYKVLDRLKEKFGARTSQLLQDISHRNLWKVFGPVVARKRVQVLQDFHFNHPKIPQHLLYILQHPVAFGCQFSHFKGTSTSTSAFIHYHTPSSVTVKLTSGKVDLHQLVSDHISTSIQHCVGVDAWNHFTGSIQGTSYEDDHRAWKRCMYIWQKYASGDSAASEVQRNLLSEASTAFVHYIKEIILL